MLKNRVEFRCRGKVTRARMNSACLFALPSVYEPFGLNALEAMSIGVPVVSYVNDGAQFMLKRARVHVT